MKTVLLSLSFVVCIIIAESVDVTERKYPRFVKVPDEEGILRVVDLEAHPDAKPLKNVQRNPAGNEYWLFTRRNPTRPHELIRHASITILHSNFNANNPTVVIVHGWLSRFDSPNNLLIRDAYLDKEDVNVIVLDWSDWASTVYTDSIYVVPSIGQALGDFLSHLSRLTGAPLSTFHLIGLGLGAHVVGSTGRHLNGEVARITALDPAGPLWDKNPDRLTSNDAIYVESIHTDASPNGLGIGFSNTVGHVDFFPNGGISQPGCDNSRCNHDKSWKQFAATITYDHLVGRRCNDIAEVITDSCRGSNLNMGNTDLNKMGFGLFRVNTGSEHPF